MKKQTKRKLFIICCITTLILSLVIMFLYFNTTYVFINNHIYRKNIDKLSVDFNESNIYLRDIKKLYNLKELSINSVSKDDELYYIEELSTLNKLNIRFSDISDLTFINSLSNIKELYVIATCINFSNIDNSNLKKIELISCELIGVEDLSKFQKLEEIYMYNIDVVDIHSLSMIKNVKSLHLGKIGEIKNADELSSLESIEKLVIHDSSFSLDYTILCDLPNLKYVGLSENTINNEEKNVLQEKGIYVKIYTEE